MKREHIIRLTAGTLVLTGLALHTWVHPAWIWLSAFVGANLFQSALTKWCLLESILQHYKIGECPLPKA